VPGVFSQYRIGRDFLYAGSLLTALSLIFAVFSLGASSIRGEMVSLLMMGTGTGLILAAVLFEIRMKQFEKMANENP
jgi:hypothetical protein